MTIVIRDGIDSRHRSVGTWSFDFEVGNSHKL